MKATTRRPSRLFAAIALVTALAACRYRAEKALVDQFFSASRLGDKTAAQSVSTVFFDPKEQGLVRQFTIEGVTPEEVSGGVASKNVTLNASVESPDGAQAQKTIIVTLQRKPGAAWMITGVMVAVPAPPPSRDPSAPPR